MVLWCEFVDERRMLWYYAYSDWVTPIMVISKSYVVNYECVDCDFWYLKRKLMRLCMFYEIYLCAFRTLREWSVYDEIVVVLLKGYYHMHTYAWILYDFKCFLTIYWF